MTAKEISSLIRLVDLRHGDVLFKNYRASSNFLT
jgi:hypothetical protein